MASEIAIAKTAAAADGMPVDAAYLKIRDLIYRISGIYYAEEKLYLLMSRCVRRMAELRATSPAEYFEHLTIRGNRDAELRLLLNEITIG
jgi:chemotaxis methyl-accepting protein methylase